MEDRRILVLDCTPKKEPREGQLLKSFFAICKVFKPRQAASLYYPVTSKTKFLKKLGTKKRYDIIHISAHGSSTGIGCGKAWEVSPDEIKSVHSARTKLVHVSACQSSYKEMADAFNSEFFLAPRTDIEWIDAAMFSMMFYKRYIVDGISMRNAFEYARTRTQTASVYPNLWEE
ncbi:MAG TPA: hypothetical protein VK487_03115 [Candidatus Bathyarchaeia archaeon]|nr:hypothetical protein [Candidatus Bathyarchaeia archaeon]